MKPLEYLSLGLRHRKDRFHVKYLSGRRVLDYDKYRLTNQVLRPEIHSVLDVGCRDAILKKHLRDDIAYTGIDLMPGPGVDHVANAEEGLPFADASFDAVVALDLLEHVDKIWFVYDELLRVARRQVVVVLPNAYHWQFRLRYLRGREVDKYMLPPEPILDRHRWLLSYSSASRFCGERAGRAGWSAREIILHGSRRTLPVNLALSLVSKNLGAWAVMFVMIPLPTDDPRANEHLDTFDDHAFTAKIRQWVEGFHGEIAPQRAETLDQRVRSYLRQELLYREKVRFLLDMLPTVPRTGLDIGSSAGGLSVALAQRGITVEGIEPSLAGVEVSKMRARRLGMSNVHFQQGVGEHLPFSDSTFDFVTSLAVPEHVQDVRAVVEETSRVLKPGGWAYFEVPNNLFPFEGHYKMAWLPMMPKPLAKLYVRVRGAYPRFLEHLHYMNRWIVMRHFRKAGFTHLRDVYADYLSGKAAGAAWAERSGRLARMPRSAPLVRLLCGPLPSAWPINRAVCLIAMKPDNRNGH